MPKFKTTEASPAELFGPLLAQVQERAILTDGKTFVDAVPRRPVSQIMADFAKLSAGDDELLRFVTANFDLPSEAESEIPRAPNKPLREYIRATWGSFARAPAASQSNSSALPVAHRHVVPGGRFREIYYWDSFFTLLGLVRDGELELADGMVDAMTDLIEDYGYVPNGTRTYYLGRSQPPLFFMMVALLGDRTGKVAQRRLAAMKREHAWWMSGERTIAPRSQLNHLAMLSDNSLLNRYWDPRTSPRDESWREDVETALATRRDKQRVYRDLRAGAESGWDFSSRWLDGPSLSSIRTTSIVPVDLNAFLFGLESAIADAGDKESALYRERASRRCEAIQRHLWDPQSGWFADYDLELASIRPQFTAAALAPLLTGIATADQAASVAAHVRSRLLAPGGLRTTLVQSGQQWDLPNGWAPLQWIAFTGLARYGHEDLAHEIAGRWISTVNESYLRTGLLFEKYDVETMSIGGGGEYSPQVGFGWTNGVTADLIDTLVASCSRSLKNAGRQQADRQLPPAIDPAYVAGSSNQTGR